MNRRYLLSNLVKPSTDYGNKGVLYISGDITVNHNESNKGNNNYFITDITPNSGTDYTKYEFSKTDVNGNVVKNTTMLDISRFGELFSDTVDTKQIGISVDNIDLQSDSGITYFPINDFLTISSAVTASPLTSFYISNNTDNVKITQDDNWIDREAIAVSTGGVLRGLKVFSSNYSFTTYINKFSYYYNDIINYYGSYCWVLADSTLTPVTAYNYHSSNECFLDGDVLSQYYENDETARVFVLDNAICITSCDDSTNLNQTVSVPLDNITPVYYNGTEWANLNTVVSSLNYTISAYENGENPTILNVNTTCPMRFNPEYGIYFVTDDSGSITKIDIALPTVNETWTEEQLNTAKNNLYIILGFQEGMSGSSLSNYIIDPTRIESVSKSSAHTMAQIYGCQCDVLTLSLNNTVDYTITPNTFIMGYAYWVKNASIFPNIDEESAQANIEKVSWFIGDQFNSFEDVDNTVWHSGRFHISDFFA